MNNPDKLTKLMNNLAIWQLLQGVGFMGFFAIAIYIATFIPFGAWPDQATRIISILILCGVLAIVTRVYYIFFLQQLWQLNNLDKTPSRKYWYFIGLIPFFGSLLLNCILALNAWRRNKSAAVWSWIILVGLEILCIWASAIFFIDKELTLTDNLLICTALFYYLALAFAARLILLPYISQRRYTKSTKIAFVCFAVLIVLSMTSAHLTKYYQAKRVDAVKSNLRAMNVPLTLAELEKYYYADGPGNEKLLQLSSPKERFLLFESDLLQHYKDYPIGELKKIEDLEATDKPLLAKFEANLYSKPDKYPFNFKVNNAAELEMPPYDRLRTHAKLNAAKMFLAAERGDRAEAMAILKRGDAEQQMLLRQPFIVSGLVYRAINNILIDGINDVLASQILTEADLKEIQQWASKNKEQLLSLGAIMFLGDVIYLESSEKAKDIDYLVNNFSGKNFEPTPAWKNFILKKSLVNPIKIAYECFISNETLILAKYWEKTFTIINDPDFNFEKIYTDSYLDEQESSVPKRGLFSGILLPSLNSCTISLQQSLDRNQMLQIAAQIELFRLKNNRLPKDLAELNWPEMPIDSFSGKPYIYQIGTWLQLANYHAFYRERTLPPTPVYEYVGYRLYSIGINQVDDNGENTYYSTPDKDDNTLYVAKKSFLPLPVIPADDDEEEEVEE